MEAQVKEAELKAAVAEAKLKESEAAMTARMEAEALSHKTEVERLQKEKSEAALSLRTTLDSGRSEAIEQATSQLERALELQRLSAEDLRTERSGLQMQLREATSKLDLAQQQLLTKDAMLQAATAAEVEAHLVLRHPAPLYTHPPLYLVVVGRG